MMARNVAFALSQCRREGFTPVIVKKFLLTVTVDSILSNKWIPLSASALEDTHLAKTFMTISYSGPGRTKVDWFYLTFWSLSHNGTDITRKVNEKCLVIITSTLIGCIISSFTGSKFLILNMP